jgi:hypothetical protein
MYVLVTMRSLKKLIGGFLLKGELGKTIGSAALGGEISFRIETASIPPVPTYSKIFFITAFYYNSRTKFSLHFIIYDKECSIVTTQKIIVITIFYSFYDCNLK